MRSAAVPCVLLLAAACAHAPNTPLVVDVKSVIERQLNTPLHPDYVHDESNGFTTRVTVQNATSEPLHVDEVKLSSYTIHSRVAFDETVAPGATAVREFRRVVVSNNGPNYPLSDPVHATITYRRPAESTPRTMDYVVR